MDDIRTADQILKDRLSKLYQREDTLSDEEYEDMELIEAYLEAKELRELNERRM